MGEKSKKKELNIQELSNTMHTAIRSVIIGNINGAISPKDRLANAGLSKTVIRVAISVIHAIVDELEDMEGYYSQVVNLMLLLSEIKGESVTIDLEKLAENLLNGTEKPQIITDLPEKLPENITRLYDK